ALPALTRAVRAHCLSPIPGAGYILSESALVGETDASAQVIAAPHADAAVAAVHTTAAVVDHRAERRGRAHAAGKSPPRRAEVEEDHGAAEVPLSGPGRIADGA